jgi:outer membrane protein
MMRFSPVAASLILGVLSGVSRCEAQQGQQPPPFTAPAPPMPNATQSPGQQPVPGQQRPPVAPGTPLPQPDQTTIDFRQIEPLSAQPLSPPHASPEVQRATDSKARPDAEAPSPFNTRVFSLIGPYRAPRVPQIPAGSLSRLQSLLRDGKLYLTLHDAITLAIENNLDVEVSRYDLLLADTDLTRAQGGGNLRGIDYTIVQTPPGVGEETSPLLFTATTGNASSTNATITDLSQVSQVSSSTQQSISQNGTSTYSAGPSIPLYDPTLSGQAAYFRRSDQNSLVSLGATSAETGPQNFLSTGIDYQEGFSIGTQLDAFVDNASQVLYGSGSQYDPFHAPSTSITLTQPLLRGAGRGVNLRFIRIAQLDRHASRLVFEQQLLATIYGISRLYYDLVSLGENVGVQQESLAAAQRLYDDDTNQVNQGTLAPIELTRVAALLSSSRLALIQAQAEYRQQEVILRQQLLRKLGDPAANFASIVPQDRITVPDAPPALDIPALIQDALDHRPDLAQAALQVKTDEISASAARNYVKPGLYAYANAQTRGSYLSPIVGLGSPGNGMVTVPGDLNQGGLRQETVYQGGVQLSLPLRNRIAQADAARDEIQLRQAQGRSLQLENQIRQQIENAAVALENAHQAYAAAVESRNYQQQLLQAEKDKFSVGESTNYLVVQDEAYLAQARSTEVAARSDWMKAQIALDQSLGNLLEKNSISLDDAIRGKLP